MAHYFSDSFLKLAGNEYCSKLEKRIQGAGHIYTPKISYFLESPLDIWTFSYFKVVSRTE